MLNSIYKNATEFVRFYIISTKFVTDFDFLKKCYLRSFDGIPAANDHTGHHSVLVLVREPAQSEKNIDEK